MKGLLYSGSAAPFVVLLLWCCAFPAILWIHVRVPVSAISLKPYKARFAGRLSAPGEVLS